MSAMVFEPVSQADDHIGGDDDGETDAIMLIALQEDRRVSFVVDSGAQAHNLQDLEAFGLERPHSSATGFVVSPPTGTIGLPNAPIDGGDTRPRPSTPDHLRPRRRMDHLSSFRTWRALRAARTTPSPFDCSAGAECRWS